MTGVKGKAIWPNTLKIHNILQTIYSSILKTVSRVALLTRQIFHCKFIPRVLEKDI